MGAPGYALAVWFDTYVRPRLAGEKSIEKVGEKLFSRYAEGLFSDLATLEGEFSLKERQVEGAVMATIIDTVIRNGRPVSNRYYGREVSEQELENTKLEKEKPNGALGVG